MSAYNNVPPIDGDILVITKGKTESAKTKKAKTSMVETARRDSSDGGENLGGGDFTDLTETEFWNFPITVGQELLTNCKLGEAVYAVRDGSLFLVLLQRGGTLGKVPHTVAQEISRCLERRPGHLSGEVTRKDPALSEIWVGLWRIPLKGNENG